MRHAWIVIILFAGCATFAPQAAQQAASPEVLLTDLKEIYRSPEAFVFQWKTPEPQQPLIRVVRVAEPFVDLRGKGEVLVHYTASTDERWHQVAISGLAQGTAYYLRIDEFSYSVTTPIVSEPYWSKDDVPMIGNVSITRVRAMHVLDETRHGILLEWETDILPSWQAVQIAGENLPIESTVEVDGTADAVIPLHEVEPTVIMLPREEIFCDHGCFSILIPEKFFLNAQGIRIYTGSAVTSYPSIVDMRVMVDFEDR